MGVYNSFCAYAISINFFLCWPIYYINNVLKYAFSIVPHEDNYNQARRRQLQNGGGGAHINFLGGTHNFLFIYLFLFFFFGGGHICANYWGGHYNLNINSVLHCLYSDRLHRARYDNNIIG